MSQVELSKQKVGKKPSRAGRFTSLEDALVNPTGPTVSSQMEKTIGKKPSREGRFSSLEDALVNPTGMAGLKRALTVESNNSTLEEEDEEMAVIQRRNSRKMSVA